MTPTYRSLSQGIVRHSGVYGRDVCIRHFVNEHICVLRQLEQTRWARGVTKDDDFST
jgi:hypothetical protein